jgi:hypothetical protein
MPLGVVGVLSGRTLDCLTYAENKYRQRFCELSELTGGDTFRRNSYPAIFLPKEDTRAFKPVE